MKKVYSAKDITEAHLVRGLLEEHGIEASVEGFYLQGGIGEIASMDFTNVSVEDDDYERAKQVVEDYDNGKFALDEDTFNDGE